MSDTALHDHTFADADWQLGGDWSLVWRGAAPALVPIGEATPAELATGIASVEALAASVLNRFLRAKRLPPMAHHRRQDCIAYLITSAWLEAKRAESGFDPTRGRIGGYVTQRLQWRLIDWYRTEVGIQSHDDKRPPESVSLDAGDRDTLGERLGEPEHGDALARGDLIGGANLSDGARWALVHVAVPLAAGHKLGEVIRATGRSRHAVNAAMDALRAELLEQGFA